MSNTWPKGYRHAMSQGDHEKWNSGNYPGTLQICTVCDSPTGRCEDDSLFSDEDEIDGETSRPLCEECWGKTQPTKEPNE